MRPSKTSGKGTSYTILIVQVVAIVVMGAVDDCRVRALAQLLSIFLLLSLAVKVNIWHWSMFSCGRFGFPWECGSKMEAEDGGKVSSYVPKAARQRKLCKAS